jgi:hypothetical protein
MTERTIITVGQRHTDTQMAQRMAQLRPAPKPSRQRRYGRWVPWILLLIWLTLTAFAGVVMLLWWLIFMPIAIIGHHFGMEQTADKHRREPTGPTEPLMHFSLDN